MAGGTTVEALEVSPNGEWLYIVLPGLTTERAWIYLGLVDEVLENKWEIGETRSVGTLPTGLDQIDAPIALLLDTFDDALSPAWSPDGRQVVFVHEDFTQTDHRDLYLLDLEDGAITRLTDRDANDTDPQWSPDGSALVFTVAPTAGTTPAIHLVHSDGTHEGLLTHGHSPKWSPDGEHILFTRYKDLNLLDIATGQEAQLTNNPAAEAGAVWFPEGSQIAFHADRAGGYDLFLINADGTGLRWLSHPGQDDLFPRWSPVGQGLVSYSTVPHVGPGSLLVVGLGGFAPWGE